MPLATAPRRRVVTLIGIGVVIALWAWPPCASSVAEEISVENEIWSVQEFPIQPEQPVPEQLPLTITSSDWNQNTLVVDNTIIMSPTPAWSAVLQGVVMHRDDDIDLRWDDGGNQRVSTVESELNGGFELRVSHQTPFGVSRPGKFAEFSLLSLRGEGETTFHPGEYYANEGELLTTRAAYGWTNLLLRGRSETAFGVRYSHIQDAIDHVSLENVAVGENHVITFDASATGYWDWRVLVFSAGLSAGIGGSLIDQSGVRTDGTLATFHAERAEFAASYTANADVLWKLTEKSFLSVGARGFMVHGVAQARDTWGYADESSTARWVGMSLGVWRDF
ncbi:secreted protein [Rhodopirellula sallentina SM41]|uniref:Secreted protein n=1 Tax=Rhodopirellula sallentina SM41 TaxID=1263870 RepID=M5TX45_9BACT|nr:secreted protein [Rhodopirellula sallentina SM41]